MSKSTGHSTERTVTMLKPKLVDDDKNTISVTVDGAEVMTWVYGSREDRAEKMRHAWYFCDGFMAGQGEPRKPWAGLRGDVPQSDAAADAEMVRSIAQA